MSWYFFLFGARCRQCLLAKLTPIITNWMISTKKSKICNFGLTEYCLAVRHRENERRVRGEGVREGINSFVYTTCSIRDTYSEKCKLNHFTQLTLHTWNNFFPVFFQLLVFRLPLLHWGVELGLILKVVSFCWTSWVWALHMGMWQWDNGRYQQIMQWGRTHFKLGLNWID